MTVLYESNLENPMPENHPTKASPLTPWALVSLSILIACPVLAAPSITQVPKGLSAQGITPGGRAIWWSVAYEHPDSFVTVVQRLEEKVDDDLDGTVAFGYDGELPDTSLWLVVDVATGTYGTFAPVDFGVTETALPPEAAQSTAGRGPVDEFLEAAHPLIDVLLVRPGQGAWELRAGDGADADQDGGIEGEIRFAIDGMSPVGATAAPPARYADGDRLLSIDLEHLELSSLLVSLAPPPPGAAAAQAGVRR